MKKILLMFIFIIVSCASENNTVIPAEQAGEFTNTTASIKINNVDDTENPPVLVSGVETTIDYSIISTGKFGVEPEEDIKNSSLKILGVSACFNNYCIPKHSVVFDTLRYNSALNLVLTVDYKELEPLQDGTYTLRLEVEASEDIDNVTTTKRFYSTFGDINLNKPYYPSNHNIEGFNDKNSLDFHCHFSCQLPYGNWLNTPSKDCVVCHNKRPITDSGFLHHIN